MAASECASIRRCCKPTPPPTGHCLHAVGLYRLPQELCGLQHVRAFCSNQSRSVHLLPLGRRVQRASCSACLPQERKGSRAGAAAQSSGSLAAVAALSPLTVTREDSVILLSSAPRPSW